MRAYHGSDVKLWKHLELWFYGRQEAFRAHWVEPRRVEARRLLRQAIKKSEIRADLDPDRVLDLLYGPLYLRLLLKHAPLDEDFVNTVFEVVSPALCTRTDAS